MNYLKSYLPLLCSLACLHLMPLTAAQTNSPAGKTWSVYKKETLNVLPKLEGWCSREKAERMMELVRKVKPHKYVEIGVFGGSSFLPTAAAMHFEGRGIAIAVDPWSNASCVEGMDSANAAWWAQIDLDKILNGFRQMMSWYNLDGRYCVFRMTSKQALDHFWNNSIDILHIDGNHSTDSALFDVTNWLPKVRKGGYIWFDDANWPSTKVAVDYLMQSCILDPSSKPDDPYLLFQKQ
jgi:predicted O-methyltransferase YrrM